MGALWAGNLYRDFTVGNDYFVHYLRNFRAKEMSAARNRWRKESYGAETVPQVSSYTGY